MGLTNSGPKESDRKKRLERHFEKFLTGNANTNISF